MASERLERRELRRQERAARRAAHKAERSGILPLVKGAPITVFGWTPLQQESWRRAWVVWADRAQMMVEFEYTYLGYNDVQRTVRSDPALVSYGLDQEDQQWTRGHDVPVDRVKALAVALALRNS